MGVSWMTQIAEEVIAVLASDPNAVL